jgi:lipooligosaccharide transport system permease protein
VAARMLLRVVEREAMVYRRLWRGSTAQSFVNPVLFLGAMGVGLGGLVDGDRDLGGLSYLEFLAPGLMAASVVLMAAVDSLWPVLGGFKWFRGFHAMAATPLRGADIYGGLIVWSALRTTLAASVFLLVATLFGAILSPWAVLAVPAVVLGGSAVAAPLHAFSATQETDAAFPLIVRLGILPLFLFSGTFFPIEQLPDGLEPVAQVSPLFHSASLARAATTGTGDLAGVLGHVAVLAVFVAAGVVLGTRAFTRRLAA